MEITELEFGTVWRGILAGRGVAALAKELVLGCAAAVRGVLAFLICLLLLCIFVRIAIAIAFELLSRLNCILI